MVPVYHRAAATPPGALLPKIDTAKTPVDAPKKAGEPLKRAGEIAKKRKPMAAKTTGPPGSAILAQPGMHGYDSRTRQRRRAKGAVGGGWTNNVTNQTTVP